MNIPSRERDAWNFDEAQSFLKYSLCQIEIDRQAAIADRFDTTGAVLKADMPDVWAPLRELTHNLLPHLQFHRIDLTNRDQIKCLWHVHSKDVLVDIDDLSSGEKAIIQMFVPLIEHQVNRHLASMRGAGEVAALGPVAVLMDEPELHLHPNLQAKVLDYIRALSLRESVQFILATHSPSMVEQAVNEELYLLRPAELTAGDANQLVRIASDEERLATLRAVFGSTSNVTALRTILVVEGRAADKGSRRPADGRIYGFLSDQFGQLTVLSGGGKSECQTLIRTLNELLVPIAPNLKAVALLDRDTLQDEPTGPGVMYLPVSMVENLLIDPDVVFKAIATVLHKTSFQTPEDVARAIDTILDELFDHEVSRRVKAAVSSRTFRIHDPVTEARRQVEEFAESILGELSQQYFEGVAREATENAGALKSAVRRRELYDGKKIIDEFFKRHLHDSGMSKEIFVYLCAKEASSRHSVSKFVQVLFGALGILPPQSGAAEPPVAGDAHKAARA
ncbi:MAG: ATP-binding protein [Sulfuricaulis sp.]|uniref:AAA family ATPase n=1 Tax=Sulfuricaulis sp. TaxID=2003553 RepID=UPI0025EED887|nr:AAA family ATPase [Sulfuricaulis sp.]MCR4346937.1 ATP-binding protein [Sulfuricaulis sp.]